MVFLFEKKKAFIKTHIGFCLYHPSFYYMKKILRETGIKNKLIKRIKYFFAFLKNLFFLFKEF